MFSGNAAFADVIVLVGLVQLPLVVPPYRQVPIIVVNRSRTLASVVTPFSITNEIGLATEVSVNAVDMIPLHPDTVMLVIDPAAPPGSPVSCPATLTLHVPVPSAFLSTSVPATLENGYGLGLIDPSDEDAKTPVDAAASRPVSQHRAIQ